MRQTLFLITVTGYCTFRSFAEPFWAVLMYYGLAVLRPQSIWGWALPRSVRWSLFAALAAIGTAVLQRDSLGQRV